jgi:TRPM family ion channel
MNRSRELTGLHGRRAILGPMIGPVREFDAAAALDGLADALATIDATGRALALIGGADFTEPELLVRLRAFFATLAAHCERTGTAVVDGGTDSGVMRLIAEARRSIGGTFPLVGVAPVGALRRRTRTGQAIEPAHDHTLILLVPGAHFGDETAILFATADHLGGPCAPAIVVNGGALALDEAHARLNAGGVVVAVEGSGRAADELARTLDDDPGLRASGRLRTIPLSVDEADLARGLTT